MKSLIKYILIAIAIGLVCLWVMTVAKSCNNPIDSTLSTVGDATNKAGDMIVDGADAVTDKVKDLTSDDEEDEFDDAEFDEEGDEILDDEDDDEDDEEMDDEDEDDEDEDLDERTITSSSGGSGVDGRYLVVSGSFLGESNALNEVARLKKMGYRNAELVVFDFSQYHTVCVKRTNSLSEARSIKNQLAKEQNIEAYVHKKRKGKRG